MLVSGLTHALKSASMKMSSNHCYSMIIITKAHWHSS